jgi:hypothetical protein
VSGRDRDTEAATAVMAALDLAIDFAFHDGHPRDLAVATEAYALAGYADPSCNLSHSGGRARADSLIAQARAGRPRRLLRADARGMLAAFRLLAATGVITYQSCAEAKRLRWLARGGHNV